MDKSKKLEALRKITKGFVDVKDECQIEIKYADDVIKKKKSQK